MLFIDDIPIGFGSLNFEQLMTSVKRFVIRVKLQLIICTRKLNLTRFRNYISIEDIFFLLSMD